MKIFQVLEFNQFNTGSVHQMFQAATGLRERGHDVAIVSKPDATLEAKARENGVAFHGFPFRHQFDVDTVRRLRRLIRAEQPDVIHVHKGVSHALALAAIWRHPVGAFVVNRGVSFPLDLWNRGKYRTHRVDRVVTVCRQIKDVIVSSGKLPPEKVEVVYAGTDVDLFDPAKWDARAFRREKNVGDDKFVIAQVGVRDWKGWKELVDSISDVVPRHPNVHLLLIGCRNETEKNEVNDYALAAGVAEHVSAIEYRTDMPNVFASCDLVVDASWAGTGITGTVREAMAMEKPVIATDAGGNRELVTSSDVGWLIPMKDRAALTGALLEVIGDRARSTAVGKAAREHVVKGYSKELRITRLETLYAEILRGRGLPARKPG
ncbi:MAG TPA: glycosyltransferase family 4 protein [Thermoanaerobaculia bacterium]|jgi:glycosyltransferase involved in cell wall biosynthesis|nr:glycosyltransferase family 4 protein [Thermoanaerobaculia bacterium]